MNVLQHTRDELNLWLKQNRPDSSYRWKYCTGIAEVVGSNPAQSLKIFSGLCSSSVTAALALMTVSSYRDTLLVKFLELLWKNLKLARFQRVKWELDRCTCLSSWNKTTEQIHVLTSRSSPFCFFLWPFTSNFWVTATWKQFSINYSSVSLE